jgi:hypothetical protein
MKVYGVYSSFPLHAERYGVSAIRCKLYYNGGLPLPITPQIRHNKRWSHSTRLCHLFTGPARMN